ncbi:MAG: hypothetical protein DHS20C10_13660 [marine bacterium B5-7]|nr:MAG: hypothetical protein DHS20C10_13660 [marine bacterium B5-7]
MECSEFRRVTWLDVREKIHAVNPELATIIDALSPSHQYPLYLAKYPYGHEIVKRGKFMVPNPQGQQVPLDHSSVDKTVQNDLGYNLMSNPVSLILSKSVEISLTDSDRTVLLLSGLVKTGTLIGTGRILSEDKPYQPAFLWNITAGARSIFLLPKVANASGFLRLKNTYNLSSEKPKNIFDHWKIFKEISAENNHSNAMWDSEILYFSKHWFDSLLDSAWKDFYIYLLRSHNKFSSYWLCEPVWSLIYSLIKKKLSLKPDAFIFHTVKHLISIAAGGASAFAPAVDDIDAPISLIQKAFVETYRLTNYNPIVMTPASFDMYDKQAKPVYYSLQFPNLLDFSPKSSESETIVSELYKVLSLLEKCLCEIEYGGLNITGTPMHDVAKRVDFTGYHPRPGGYRKIQHPQDIATDDMRFYGETSFSENNFPENASFFKGVISLSHREVR